MGVKSRLSIVVATLVLAVPAAAQFSDSYSFLQAVKDRDGDKVMPLVNKPGSPVLASRDNATGEGALHIVVKRHDTAWLSFLLDRGAQPDMRDRQGVTPLILAAQTGDVDAARMLLSYGAKPNFTNNNGETALTLAVHTRNLAMIRQLVSAGADPKIRDTIAGKSAVDYAQEDPRGTAIQRVLQDAKPKPVAGGPVAGPKL